MRIVADNVALVEIFQLQRGVGAHGDWHVFDRDIKLAGSLNVVDHASDGVAGDLLKRRSVPRNQGPHDRALALGRNFSVIGDGCKAGQLGDLDVEQIFSR